MDERLADALREKHAHRPRRVGLRCGCPQRQLASLQKEGGLLDAVHVAYLPKCCKDVAVHLGQCEVILVCVYKLLRQLVVTYQKVAVLGTLVPSLALWVDECAAAELAERPLSKRLDR